MQFPLLPELSAAAFSGMAKGSVKRRYVADFRRLRR